MSEPKKDENKETKEQKQQPKKQLEPTKDAEVLKLLEEDEDDF